MSRTLNINIDQMKKPRKDWKISVIIPLYNEENSIQSVLEDISQKHHNEIIIIDDGSTDRSLERIKEMNLNTIKIFSHKKNMGYGAAVLTGINKAHGDIIVTLDSDGQHDPREIPILIRPLILKKARMIVGSRYLGHSHYTVPFHTRMGEFLVDLFLFLLFGQLVGNNQNGFRAFFKKDIENLKNNINYTNYGFCTETIFLYASEGLKVKEVPIHVRPREFGKSYVNIFKILVVISTCIIKYGLKRVKLLEHVPDFLKHMFLFISRS
ncbi:MAG: glycosyltransferase family 2 protein [Promethearchaeota archaeon]|nr:MAG: glycosyltransferase family 2 protein [Candidatus Lokiarchaeota archaeon]